MKPPRSCLDPEFAYTPSKDHEGDPTYLLRKFRRMQKEQRENQRAADAQQQANDTEAAVKVAPLQRRKAAP